MKNFGLKLINFIKNLFISLKDLVFPLNEEIQDLYLLLHQVGDRENKNPLFCWKLKKM